MISWIGISLAAVPAALGCALIAHSATFEVLYIDNVLAEPVQVFVDGQVIGTFEPRTGDTVPELVEVRRGLHRIAYAPVYSAAPEHERELVIVPGGQLYNPGASACYWLEQVTPPSIPALGPSQPLPRSEIYGGGIQAWFGEIPIEGPHRYGQLMHYPTCTALVRAGCETEADRLIECARESSSYEGIEACEQEALSACEAAR